MEDCAVYNCACCKKQFNSQKDLIQHDQQFHHNIDINSVCKPKKYVCKFCAKTYHSNYAFKIHLRVHSDNIFYSCSLCERSFKSKQYLNVHKKKHLITKKVRRQNQWNRRRKRNLNAAEDVIKIEDATITTIKEEQNEPICLSSHNKRVDERINTVEWTCKIHAALDINNDNIQSSSNQRNNIFHNGNVIRHGNKIFKDTSNKEIINLNNIPEIKEEILESDNQISMAPDQRNNISHNRNELNRGNQISVDTNNKEIINLNNIPEIKEEILDSDNQISIVPDQRNNISQNRDNQISADQRNNISHNQNELNSHNKISIVPDNREIITLNNITDIKEEILDSDNLISMVNLTNTPDIKEEILDSECHDPVKAEDIIEISNTEFIYDKDIINAANRKENIFDANPSPQKLTKDNEHAPTNSQHKLTKDNEYEHEHPPNDTPKKFICKFCYRSFQELHHLNSHLLVHNDQQENMIQLENISNTYIQNLNIVGNKNLPLTNNNVGKSDIVGSANTPQVDPKHWKLKELRIRVKSIKLPKVPKHQNKLRVKENIISIDEENKYELLNLQNIDDIENDPLSIASVATKIEDNQLEDNPLLLKPSETMEIPKDTIFVNKVDVTKEDPLEINIFENRSRSNKNELKLITKRKFKILTDNICVACDKIFNFQRDFIKHTQIYHSKAKCFKCRNCINIFKNLKILYRHNKRNHKVLTPQHLCEYCSKSFYTRRMHRVHIKLCAKADNDETNWDDLGKELNDVNDIKIKSNACDDNFLNKLHERELRKENLERHSTVISNEPIFDTIGKLIVHKKEEQFKSEKEKTQLSGEFKKHPDLTDRKCAKCNKKFIFLRDLVKHAKQYHPYAKAFKCRDCNEVFKKLFKLTRHHKTVHNGEQPYYCSFCKKSFKRNSVFKMHQKWHMEEKSIHKNESDSETDDETKHKSTYDEDYHASDTETDDESDQNSMYGDDNNASHTQRNAELQTKNVSCLLCTGTFSTKENFQRHLERVHPNRNVQISENSGPSDESPVSCKICVRTFPTKDSLERHSEIFHPNKSAQLSQNSGPSDNRSLGLDFKNPEDLHFSKYYIAPIEVDKKCGICNEFFPLVKDLVIHANRNHLYFKAFKCRSCELYFSALWLLTDHHGTIHASEYPYSCSKCGKGHKLESDLTAHQKIHVSQEEASTNEISESVQIPEEASTKEIRCEICLKTFTRQSNLRRHIRGVHTKAIINSCGLLEKTNKPDLNENPKFTSNLKLSHKFPNLADKMCIICKEVFDNQHDLIKHAFNLHPNERAIKCAKCDMIPLKLRYLKRHMRNIHKDVSLGYVEHIFACTVCTKSYKDATQLKYHMYSHFPTTKFICEICAKVFHHGNSFRKHVISHGEERPHGCSQCDLKFKHLDNLKKHKKTHLRIRKPSVIDSKCPICDETFKFQNLLIRHAKECHPNQQAFKCRDCEALFTNECSVTRHHKTYHLNIRATERKYPCYICEKSFILKHHLRNHLETHLKEGKEEATSKLKILD